jgi:hypothetical protein
MAHSIIGERTLERPVEFILVLKSKTSKKPLFVSDGLPHYEHALVNTYSTVVLPSRTGSRGRPRGPRRIIDTDLDYAMVHKTRSKGRVVRIERTSR